MGLRFVAALLFITVASGGSIAGSAPATSAVPDGQRGRLIDAAIAGGDYLVRMQRSDGRFYYWYDPADDRLEYNQYNMVRHAGAALSLFDLYSATRDKRFLDSARLAISFLTTRFRDAAGESGGPKRGLYVLDFDGKAKLGANGLALLAMARSLEIEKSQALLSSADGLASLILSMQRPDGSYDSYYRIKGDEPSGSVSLYYPGEAMLGLLALHKLNGKKELLESAVRGADFLIESQRKLKEPPPDAWLMQALEVLFKISNEKRYAEHAIALATTLIGYQYGENSAAGQPGGFGPDQPDAGSTASRVEGIVAAYRIAEKVKHSNVPKLAKSLRAATDFLLSKQFTRANSFFFPRSDRAAGGFPESMTSMVIRIDFVQHSISALLGVAKTVS